MLLSFFYRASAVEQTVRAASSRRSFSMERFLRVVGWTMSLGVSVYMLVIEITIDPDHFVAGRMLEDHVQFIGGGLMLAAGLAAVAFAEHLDRLRSIERLMNQLVSARSVTPTLEIDVARSELDGSAAAADRGLPTVTD